MRHTKNEMCKKKSCVCVQKKTATKHFNRMISFSVFVCVYGHIVEKMTARSTIAHEKILKTNFILAWFRVCTYINK